MCAGAADIRVAFATGNVASFFFTRNVVAGKAVYAAVGCMIENNIQKWRFFGFHSDWFFDGLRHLLYPACLCLSREEECAAEDKK